METLQWIKGAHEGVSLGVTSRADAESAPAQLAIQETNDWFSINPAQRESMRDLELSPGRQPCIVDFIHDDSLTADEFAFRYLLKNRPVVVLPTASSSWCDVARQKWTRSGLLQHYGSMPVKAFLSPGVEGSDVSVMELSEYIANIMDDGDTIDSNSMDIRYIFEKLPWHGGEGIANDFELPSFLSNNSDLFYGLDAELRECGKNFGCVFNLVFGPALSGVPPHSHRGAFNGVVFGKKQWFLWPGTQDQEKMGGLSDRYKVNSGYSWAKEVLPDFKSGKLQGVAPYSFTQGPGEWVYIPPGWIHAVINLEPTIAVSALVGDAKGESPI